jgi:hypothetical protein
MQPVTCYRGKALHARAPGRILRRKWTPPRDQSCRCVVCRKRITVNRGKVCNRCLKGVAG